MFGNTIFSNRENATLQCRRFRNIATISQLCHKPNHQRAPLEELTELSSKLYFRFPLDNQQLHRIKANFMACRYAGVVGATDGTHIQIIAPSKDEDVFVNRKKVHSTNTQIVVDATFNILDVVAEWPAGSAQRAVEVSYPPPHTHTM
ncbi:putative nuclease HARBI1 [Merluccius polli]|uniref:Nuclease HARBI1 n=1 Tax=Merluccius polli TaxID=89951 RepID=A0AA47P0W0_MERPO|nr:putative nuclease HARBI1 [Merluccius polli]